MPVFFSRLSYSLGNEDWETEHRALRLKPEDRVLCVTGSGDRPLHLLLKDCKEVVSVDANPIQNHLLQLKMAALQQFDFERYISFLGVLPDKSRLAHLRQLSHHLPASSAKYWQDNSKAISKGILYQGAMEKFVMVGLPTLAKLVQGKQIINQLFQFHNLEAQKDFVESKWDRVLWRMCFEFLLSPRVSKMIMVRDPGLYAHVDPAIRPGAHIYQRLNDSLRKYLARNNFWMSFLLRGHVEPHASPAYLLEGESKTIKQNLPRITIETSDIVNYLETCPEKSFDAFSLSDVASYITKNDFERLLRGIIRAAKPGARFCIREFLSRRHIPAELQSHFQRDYGLEKKLEKEDRCFLYRFFTGKVK